MTTILQIGNRVIPVAEIIPLLVTYNMIPQLLCESLIDSAIAPMACTKEETAHAQEQFYHQWDLTTEEKRQAWRSHYSLTPEQLEQLATRKLRVEKFKKVSWGNQLESYFLQRKRQLDQIIYSLIKTEHRGTANELYFRIKEGEQSFAELAREYSIGTESDTNGIIGPVEFGNLTPNFAQLLYTSPIGVIQPPVPLGELWIIVRVEKLISAQLDDFMRQRLLQEKFETWFQQQLSQLSPEEKIWMGVNRQPAQIQEAIAA